jgi:geranylgeranyl diphosphate synthase, type II
VTDIADKIKSYCSAVNSRLPELMDKMCGPGILKDSMNYSLNAGGKRMRPILCLMSAEMFGDEKEALDFACAIEMIHTYSLIHDDLPAMDNDYLRRGKPTNHVVFGEAYAILAGDGLLNCAFEVMLKCAIKSAKSINYISAMDIVAGAAGVKGMIAGQAGDIQFEGSQQGIEVLEYIHERKTAAMITASLTSGAALKGASQGEINALNNYGRCVGLVFQIIDDILDETGETDKLGKTPGKDKNDEKQTFARLYGIEKSRAIAEQKTKEAVDALEIFGEKADGLRKMAAYLFRRKY